MKEFFLSKIGYQTIAVLITVFSFPFLYVGGTQQISSVLLIGIVLMLAGMLAAPAITFILAQKMTKREVTKVSASKLSSSGG